MADLARLGRVSRARITQIMDLLMLAPEIQEEVLCSSADIISCDLAAIAALACWDAQRKKFTERN